MLDVATVVDPTLDHDDEARGHELDHRQSQHGDSASNLTLPEEWVDDKTETTEICVTSSAAEMHTVGSKTSIRSVSASNRSSVKKGTMITIVPIMTNLSDSVLLKGGAMQEESKSFPMT
jgi:hypothetical protein